MIDLSGEGYFVAGSGKSLRFLYDTPGGRMVLRTLTMPRFSDLAGHFLDSRASRGIIPGFIRKNGINASEAEDREYASFNDFFTRRLKPGSRPIDPDPDVLISPCDGLLSVFPIQDDSIFCIKNTAYTIGELLKSERAADLYHNGYCAIFRLTVSDYHRYCYPDSGSKTRNRFIPGRLHTVQPIACEHFPIYKTNCREYTVLHTAHFGEVVQMEVGALMVGKICNFHQEGSFSRGEEKGMFEFGGSTIILLLQEGRAQFDSLLLERSLQGYEKKVRMGEGVACCIKEK